MAQRASLSVGVARADLEDRRDLAREERERLLRALSAHVDGVALALIDEGRAAVGVERPDRVDAPS